MYDLIYKYVFVGFVIAGGFLMGFGIVSHYVYKPMIKYNKEEEEDFLTEDEKQVNIYITKYTDEYSELEENELNDEKLRKLSKSYLSEETPLGVVKMYYCKDNESFIYWCEKQIPYKVLETVSKKYAIEYDCKAIHVDMDYELEQKRTKLMNSTDDNVAKTNVANDNDTNDNDTNDNDTNDNVKDNNDNSVFVTFKNYKTSETTNVETTNVETTEKKSKKTKKDVVVCDRANRYSYRGKYIKEEDSPNDGETNVKNISFSEFMKAKETFKEDNTASDGFWRFLDVNYIADQVKPLPYEQSVKSIVTRSISHTGYYRLNGRQFDDVNKYHTAVMEELKNNVSCNSSDNSYDVLECDAEPITNEKNLVQGLSNDVIDTSDDDETDPKLEAVASSGDVQTGKRISRKGSVDDSEPQSQGWLW